MAITLLRMNFRLASLYPVPPSQSRANPVLWFVHLGVSFFSFFVIQGQIQTSILIFVKSWYGKTVILQSPCDYACGAAIENSKKAKFKPSSLWTVVLMPIQLDGTYLPVTLTREPPQSYIAQLLTVFWLLIFDGFNTIHHDLWTLEVILRLSCSFERATSKMLPLYL